MKSRDPDDFMGDSESGPDADDLTVMGKLELSAMTGLLPKDIDKLLREGLPTYGERGKGKAVKFNCPDVVRWLLTRQGGSIETAKRRREEATARKREAEANNLEGSHVRLDLVEELIKAGMVALRAELLSIPARLPVNVRGAVQAEIESAINRFKIDTPKKKQ